MLRWQEYSLRKQDPAVFRNIPEGCDIRSAVPGYFLIIHDRVPGGGGGIFDLVVPVALTADYSLVSSGRG